MFEWLPRFRSRYLRILFAVIVLTNVALLGIEVGTANAREGGSTAVSLQQSTDPPDGLTVITTTAGDIVTGTPSDFEDGQIVVVAPDGSVVYRDTQYNVYDDVDPGPGENTVEFVAAEHMNASACNARSPCSRNLIVQANLTTGEQTVLHSDVTPGIHNSRYHDADRVGPNQFLVADLHQNRVFQVNTSTGIVTWSWSAQSRFPLHSGGQFGNDWTHLNDVEQLPDGTIMASLRNHDQVVFLNRSTGVIEERTLGADGQTEILHRQHNPDYIPRSQGGPAVIVSDSHNDRIIEYQRNGSSWEQSWVWSDPDLHWPRDGDRLPNGNTLITDTNGNRVLEVDQNGDIVWSVSVDTPYEAERLGTGDESAGGESAQRLAIESVGGGIASERGADASSGGDSGLVDRLPSRLVDGLRYVLPRWFGLVNAVQVLVLIGTVALWIGLEVYWRRERVTIRWPISLE